MDLANKKIGIWGYGITGKSAVSFFKRLGCEIGLVEKRTLTPEEQGQIALDHVTVWPYEQLEQFFSAHDAILTSGSIDLRPYKQFEHAWLAEVDVIQQYAAEQLGKPKVIAITGTVGKTTVARLLAHILRYAGYKVEIGGNVGIGMLGLLYEQRKIDYLILELSSYQLEISKTFAPDVAVWTNFYPNHLDRHGSEQAYFDAKAKIFAFQNAEQHAVMPEELALKVYTQAQVVSRSKQMDFDHFIGDSEGDSPSTKKGRGVRSGPLAETQFSNNPRPGHPALSLGILRQAQDERTVTVIRKLRTSQVTYPENIAILEATLRALNVDPQLLEQASATFERDEHRLEKVATLAGVDIYNDSKSTVPQATIAAVQALQHKPIILLLGGVSKGVDRSTLISAIQQSCKPDCIKTAICFGGEATQLQQAARSCNVPTICCSTLEEAWAAAHSLAQAGDQVLLSPAGASYDLFKDYQERGNLFKTLVHQSQHEKGSL